MGRWRDGAAVLRIPGPAPEGTDEAAGTSAPGRTAAAVGAAVVHEAAGAGGEAGSGVGGVRVSLEVAASYRARSRGLLGRDRLDGALLLTPASGVHTFGMRFAIDVAYLDRRMTVLAVRTMRPGRVGLPRPRSRHVLEAEAGALARWGVRRGVRVSVEPAPASSRAASATATSASAASPAPTQATEA
ncbi:DUF192 domain-containing protein [Streptomyces sp. P1-3]|uniref:DUF192 domain-containing protein n=1 Tax=Streptomyces sp. P1-3 TaxID=3421658 RepID=UPI003D35F8FD